MTVRGVGADNPDAHHSRFDPGQPPGTNAKASDDDLTSPCFLNIITTRRCQSAFPHGLSDKQQGYHWHRMGDVTRSEKKHKPTLDGKPLLVEAAPSMAPRFEQTLHQIVSPTLESGHPVAVFCIPSTRKTTQKATWADHWNRRYRSNFRFVQRCLCAFDNTQQEHRMPCIGTNVPLPNHHCDALTQKESTSGLGKVATITAMVAMINILGSPIRVWRSPVLIPRKVRRHRDRLPNSTKLEHIPDDDMKDQMRPQTEQILDEPIPTYPTDAKERERRLNERSSKKKGKSSKQRRGRRLSKIASMIAATICPHCEMSLSQDWHIQIYYMKCFSLRQMNTSPTCGMSIPTETKFLSEHLQWPLVCRRQKHHHTMHETLTGHWCFEIGKPVP